MDLAGFAPTLPCPERELTKHAVHLCPDVGCTRQAEVVSNVHQVHLLRFKLLKAKYEYWLGKVWFCDDGLQNSSWIRPPGRFQMRISSLCALRTYVFVPDMHVPVFVERASVLCHRLVRCRSILPTCPCLCRARRNQVLIRVVLCSFSCSA